MNTEEKKSLVDVLVEYFWESVGGFSISSLGAIIAPEIIHLFFVIIGGVCGTVAIHYTRLILIPWLNKKFKIGKHEDTSRKV